MRCDRKEPITFYNENDPKAAAWLRELIKEGHIANGIVDDRSICDIQPGELAGFVQCHFFAGIGGWSLALRLAGWPDDEPVWTGSCPCQPLSCAGLRKGHADERHLWPAFYRLIAECKPATVFGEQVAGKDGREWLAGIRADLEGTGYAVGASDLCAAGVGAPHIRQRIYWLADTKRERRRGRESWCRDATNAWEPSEVVQCRDGTKRRIEPGTFPLAHGVSARMVKLRGSGNAIVPQVASAFIKASIESLT